MEIIIWPILIMVLYMKDIHFKEVKYETERIISCNFPASATGPGRKTGLCKISNAESKVVRRQSCLAGLHTEPQGMAETLITPMVGRVSCAMDCIGAGTAARHPCLAICVVRETICYQN